MPVYHFSGREDGKDIGSDDVGLEFDTVEEASAMAHRALRDIAADSPLATMTFWMTVSDMYHVVVYRVRLDVTVCQLVAI